MKSIIENIIKQKSLTEASETSTQSLNLSMDYKNKIELALRTQYKNVDEIDWDKTVSVKIETEIKYLKGAINGIEISVPEQKIMLGYEISFTDEKMKPVHDTYQMDLMNCQVKMETSDGTLAGGAISFVPYELEIFRDKATVLVHLTT